MCSKRRDIMKRGKRVFGFQKYTIIMCIAGVLLIIWSQLPGGYEVFTDIFMGLGTGILGGCILFLITGKKSQELYEREEILFSLHEMEDYIEKLYSLQYMVSCDKDIRDEQYRTRYGETVYRIESVVRDSSVNVKRLALNEKYRECVREMTDKKNAAWEGGPLDIMVWHEDILEKVAELNANPTTSIEEAEEMYGFISAYRPLIIKLKTAFGQYRKKIEGEKARISKSII